MMLPKVTQSMRSNLDKAVTIAKVDLSWLALYHVAVRRYQMNADRLKRQAPPKLEQLRKNLIPLPQDIQNRPESYVSGDTLQRFRNTFVPNSAQSPSDNFGHYLNKVCVTYAAAILEAFLEDTYEERTGGASIKPKPDKSGSVTAYVNIISGKACPKQPAPKDAAHLVIPDFEQCAASALKLEEQRHIIVHEHGKGQGDLAVDTVVMPLSEEAICFADVAREHFITKAQSR